MQLPECGQGVGQTFEVGELFRLAVLHMVIGLVHGSTSECGHAGFCRPFPAWATDRGYVASLRPAVIHRKS